MTYSLRTIRLLVAVMFIKCSCCQNGFDNGDIEKYKQMLFNDGQTETMNSYSTNIIQKDPSSQSMSSVNVQYHIADDTNRNSDYNDGNRERNKKNFRIKNPFYHQLEDNGKNEINNSLRDGGTAASNQYAAMRYSLPPESFLKQMRAENQYNQHNQQIITTPAPNFAYTATPEPQYQPSTVSTFNYDKRNQPFNQFQIDLKVPQTQKYLSNSNYQFGSANTLGLDTMQSTLSPVNSYLSTSFPQRYLSTPVYPYVSTSMPISVTSPSNFQTYVSSPQTLMQANTPDYNNRIISTTSSIFQNSDNGNSNNNMQTHHYDNSGHGIKYSVGMHQQDQNNYPYSTSMPLSTSYLGTEQDSGQNILNAGVNALSKSLLELSFNQFQNYPYQKDIQETQTDSNSIKTNSDTHRMGSIPLANKDYFKYVQPDEQALNTLKSQSRGRQQDMNQPGLYSYGDYGWKLNDLKPSNIDSYSINNYPRFSEITSQSNGGAVSQVNFHMDTGESKNAESQVKNNKLNTFQAKKAQQNFNQQDIFYNNNNYPSTFTESSKQIQNIGENMYYRDDEKNKYQYTGGPSPTIYTFSSSPSEVMSVAPYSYENNKNVALGNKPKPSFDHAKALQNIISIDVSNVVPNSDAQSKSNTGLENNNQYSLTKENLDQSIKQYYRTLADSFYKDKNELYGFNIKTKPEDFLALNFDKPTQVSTPYSTKLLQPQDQSYNHNNFPSASHTHGHTPQGYNNIYQDTIQLPASYQQQEAHYQNQMPSDIATILRLNDVPQLISQGLSADSLRLHNANFDKGEPPSNLPARFNQNLGSHQTDVTSNNLNKLTSNQQTVGNFNRPELEAISTINGFKVANPYNVDLKLIAEMLKGKSTVDDTYIRAPKDQFNKPAPIKLDFSPLQFLLRNENRGTVDPLSDSLSAYSNPTMNIYGSRQYPYRGVKYSRSQEEEESIIPIAETSNTHPIGAVVEQIDEENENDGAIGSDVTAFIDGNGNTNFEDEGNKKSTASSSNSRYKHLNTLLSISKKHPNKYSVEEPYRLLKPPPLQSSRHKGNHIKVDKRRRRRLNRPKVFRVLKHETLYENDEVDPEHVETTIPILLRPPPVTAENKSDQVS